MKRSQKVITQETAAFVRSKDGHIFKIQDMIEDRMSLMAEDGSVISVPATGMLDGTYSIVPPENKTEEVKNIKEENKVNYKSMKKDELAALVETLAKENTELKARVAKAEEVFKAQKATIAKQREYMVRFGIIDTEGHVIKTSAPAAPAANTAEKHFCSKCKTQELTASVMSWNRRKLGINDVNEMICMGCQGTLHNKKGRASSEAAITAMDGANVSTLPVDVLAKLMADALKKQGGNK